VLGAAQPQVLAFVLADEDALRGLLEQAGFLEIGKFGEAGVAVQGFGLGSKEWDEQCGPAQQWCAEAYGAAELDLGSVGGVLRQVCRLNVLPPRVPGRRCIWQIEDEQNKVIGEEPAACRDPQK
jgi:hypothetical protein